MSDSFCPRLSEAKHLFPLLRSHLAAAAARHPLPGVVSLDLLPIVEGGLFGYELLPDPETRVGLTIGCDARGVPMLRKTSYGPDGNSALRLAVVNGQEVTRDTRRVRHAERGDSSFPDWPSAVAEAWAQLATEFPDRSRRHIALNTTAHRFLDEALSIAHSHLATWDPFIRFFGLPNEAQHGFELHGAAGEHGVLVAQRPEIWILRWKSPPHAIYEEWSVILPDRDADADLTRA